MKSISLTNSAGTTITVFVSAIESMFPEGTGSNVQLTRNAYKVKQTPAEILQLIADAEAVPA